ncbi:hypothetical protein DFH08DRAFT_804304 [Mycena albidolilacea]|uniref:Uncharacterized protein n=1 Tax=Mycena albidolilacea TaxID=1033008 RepID=A0AAD7ACL9_9AGAR|nr:hypothetical protein DFH08DRAFT_804304 [Mycena albidolilacea]
MTQFQADQLLILNQSTLASYLCCLNSFGPIMPRIMILLDKSLLRTIMLTDLFKVLQITTIGSLINRIINTTAQLAMQAIMLITTQSQTHRLGHIDHIGLTNMGILMTEIYKFCAGLPRTVSNYGLQPVDWIYVSLQRLHISEEGQDWDDNTHFKIKTLMQALVQVDLSPPELSSEPILKSKAFSWFWLHLRRFCKKSQKRDICHPGVTRSDILQEYSAWEQLGTIALKYNHILELPTWIAVYCESSTSSDWGGHHLWMTDHFCNILCQVWVPEFIDDHKYADRAEKSWTLALAALANTWEAYDFSMSAASTGFAALAQCTISTTLRSEYLREKREITFGDDTYARGGILSNVGTTSFLKVATTFGQATQCQKLDSSFLTAAPRRIDVHGVAEESPDSCCELVVRSNWLPNTARVKLLVFRQTTITETLDKALSAITRYNGVNIYANVNEASPSLICNQESDSVKVLRVYGRRQTIFRDQHGGFPYWSRTYIIREDVGSICSTDNTERRLLGIKAMPRIGLGLNT